MTRNKRRLSSYGWVFFDLDGTLVDSLPIMRRVYSEYMKAHQREGSSKEFELMDGYSVTEIVQHLRTAHGLQPAAHQLQADYMTLIETHYPRTNPMDGAVALLTSLSQCGTSLALVTASQSAPASRLIANLGWSDLFQVKVYGDEVKHGKPSPEIYELAKTRTNAGSDAIVIEDSANGAMAARDAGLEVVLLGDTVLDLQACLELV